MAQSLEETAVWRRGFEAGFHLFLTPKSLIAWCNRSTLFHKMIGRAVTAAEAGELTRLL